ncbi:ATP synthase subunit delta', mitochondrial-like protein [Tanacetum coccineum]
MEVKRRPLVVNIEKLKKRYCISVARSSGKQWIRCTTEHYIIIDVLIANVAFAAAYTVLGVPIKKQVVLNYADVETENLDVWDRAYINTFVSMQLTEVIWKPLFTCLINLRLNGDRTKNNRADGMLPDHIPMIAELKPGLLSFREGNDVEKYFIGNGVAFVYIYSSLPAITNKNQNR